MSRPISRWRGARALEYFLILMVAMGVVLAGGCVHSTVDRANPGDGNDDSGQTGDPTAPVCGNQSCETGEDCGSCLPDCGPCPASCGVGAGSSRVTTEGCQLHADISYGFHQRHRLDIYLPATPPASAVGYPVVMLFHGGGFSTGSKEMVVGQAGVLCEQGLAAVAVNYRLNPDNYLPDQINDAKAAIRWARSRAQVCQLDGDRIGGLGGSAGATLAAVVGTSGGVAELEGDIGEYRGYSSRVQAVVALAGVYREFAWFAGCTPPEPGCQETVTLSAPISHVSADDPPFLLAIGDEDETPDGISDHQNFHQALLAVGVDATLEIVPGAHHGEVFGLITGEIVAFFDAHLRP